jgi:hypothetical protein
VVLDCAVGAVDRIFTDDLGWMFTRNEVREYGIDGHAQAVRDDGLVTGRLLATQVKGGVSRFRRPAADGFGWAFWSDNDHLHCWLGYHVPVLVVLVRPGDGVAFWQVIRPSTVSEHASGFTLVISSSQRLDGSAGEQLLAIAVNERGLLESFPTHCAVLPSSAVRVLERARDADPLPVARLAEKLATGADRAGADGQGAVHVAAVVVGGHRGRAGSVAGRRQVRPRARLRRRGRRGARRRRPGPAAGARARGGGPGLPALGQGWRPRVSGAGPRRRGGAAGRHRPSPKLL